MEPVRIVEAFDEAEQVAFGLIFRGVSGPGSHIPSSGLADSNLPFAVLLARRLELAELARISAAVFCAACPRCRA